ncbi:MAG: hypothetical protein IJM17_01625 [Firmicutes bacterium]|nr:hypothetical protein [Bacillota bacterium]
MAYTAKIVDLLNDDPKLEKLARLKGMEPVKLKAARGMTEYSRIQQDREDAEYKMAECISSNKEPEASDKEKYIKALVKGNLIQQQLMAENDKNSEVAAQKLTAMFPRVVMKSNDIQRKWKADPESRPDPGKGMIHMDTYMKLDKGVTKLFSPVADTLKDLGGKYGAKNLDLVTDEIIRQEGLMNKPIKEIFYKLNENQLDTMDLTGPAIKAADAVKDKLQKQAAEDEIQLNGPDLNARPASGPQPGIG